MLKNIVSKAGEMLLEQKQVTHNMRFPVPFQYFHLLNLMVFVNICLAAYGMAITYSVFAPFSYFFAALIFMGMMELAAELVDPYGDDDIDFPMTHWLTQTWGTCTEMCEFDDRPMHKNHWERSLARHAESLGAEGKFCKGVRTFKLADYIQEELLERHGEQDGPRVVALPWWQRLYSGFADCVGGSSYPPMAFRSTFTPLSATASDLESRPR